LCFNDGKKCTRQDASLAGIWSYTLNFKNTFYST